VTEACDPESAAALLRALAHPARLRILCRLLDGECGVSGFESELGLRQPNLSQQLGALREAALVATRREAKSVFYRLVDDRVRAVLAALRDTAPQAEPPATAQLATTRLAPPPVSIARPYAAHLAGGECAIFPVIGQPTPRGQR